MTNAEFADTDQRFREACEAVRRVPLFKNVMPTKRQASKWRRRTGAAYKNDRFMIRKV